MDKRTFFINELRTHTTTYSHKNAILGFFQIFGGENDFTERRKMLSDINSNQFLDLIKSVGGLITHGNAHEKLEFDGTIDTPLPRGELVPIGEDKRYFLIHGWELAKEFLQNPDIDNIDALNKVAIIVANTITLVHPFADGNGRVSRFISWAIANGKVPTNVFGNLVETRYYEDKNWFLHATDYKNITTQELFDICPQEDKHSLAVCAFLAAIKSTQKYPSEFYKASSLLRATYYARKDGEAMFLQKAYALTNKLSYEGLGNFSSDYENLSYIDKVYVERARRTKLFAKSYMPCKILTPETACETLENKEHNF